MACFECGCPSLHPRHGAVFTIPRHGVFGLVYDGRFRQRVPSLPSLDFPFGVLYGPTHQENEDGCCRVFSAFAGNTCGTLKAERFAMTDYLVTLAGPSPTGSQADAFYQRIAGLTGIAKGDVARARGFLDGLYARLSGESGRVVSPYDAAYSAPDAYPEAATSRNDDPILDGFASTLVQKVRNLHYRSGKSAFDQRSCAFLRRRRRLYS